jgi:hypothetical protein
MTLVEYAAELCCGREGRRALQALLSGDLMTTFFVNMSRHWKAMEVGG